MSFFPLEEVRCGPLKPRKYPAVVIGSTLTPFGYRLHERSNCRIVKFPDTFESLAKQEQREYEHLVKIQEFEEVTGKRIKRKNVRQRVQQGLAAYEDTVNARREKLREILLKEEMNLTREVIHQAQRGGDDRMDEMRRKTEEIRKETEEKRLAIVAAKRMQQLLAKCPEIREQQKKRFAVEAKQINLVQMADNEARRQAEKELDQLWHELMLTEVAAKRQREVEEVKRRCLVEQDTVKILAKQIAGKLAIEEYTKQVQKEDREYLEQLWEALRQEELRNLERERQNRERLKKELQEQVMIAKRKLAEQARHEAEIDRLRQTLAAGELAKERSNIKEASESLRKELVAYLQYLEDVRKDDAKRNMEVDRIVEQSQKDASSRRDLAVQKFKEARERALQEVLRGREEQLRIKREREKAEAEEREREKQAMEIRIETEAKLAAYYKAEQKNKMLCYKKDLEEQWKRRMDAAEEEERMRLTVPEGDQEDYQKLMDELMKASEIVVPHPFKILLKECAARYAAEKEGKCYCPPPLADENTEIYG